MIPRNAYDRITGRPLIDECTKEVKCPTCLKAMTKIPNKRLRYECKEHGQFRIVRRRRAKPKDMNDSNNWKATCGECGGIMDYFNLRYCCRKCGGILEV